MKTSSLYNEYGQYANIRGVLIEAQPPKIKTIERMYYIC